MKIVGKSIYEGGFYRDPQWPMDATNIVISETGCMPINVLALRNGIKTYVRRDVLAWFTGMELWSERDD